MWKKISRILSVSFSIFSSSGSLRKLSVAIALLGMPPLILLDEPTSKVDPSSCRSIWNAITEASELGCTILLSSERWVFYRNESFQIFAKQYVYFLSVISRSLYEFIKLMLKATYNIQNSEYFFRKMLFVNKSLKITLNKFHVILYRFFKIHN